MTIRRQLQTVCGSTFLLPSDILPPMPKRKQPESQADLQFSRSHDSSRTLVRCENCQARYIAWHGTEEDDETETANVERCGLCGGDPFKRDNFKDAVIRLVAMVTARNIRRD